MDQLALLMKGSVGNPTSHSPAYTTLPFFFFIFIAAQLSGSIPPFAELGTDRHMLIHAFRKVFFFSNWLLNWEICSIRIFRSLQNSFPSYFSGQNQQEQIIWLQNYNSMWTSTLSSFYKGKRKYRIHIAQHCHLSLLVWCNTQCRYSSSISMTPKSLYNSRIR